MPTANTTSSSSSPGANECEVADCVPSYEVQWLQKCYATREKGTLEQADISMKYGDSGDCMLLTVTTHVSFSINLEIILVIKPTGCNNFSNLFLEQNSYMFRTVPLSIIRSFSLYIQQWYMSYRFADSLRAGSGIKPTRCTNFSNLFSE